MVSVTGDSSLTNPFTSASDSMAHSPTRSSSSSDSDQHDDAAPPQPVAASVLQTVNIHDHILVVLDYTIANYSQWRCCFDTILGKFGLENHVRSPTLLAQRNAEWHQIDSCIVN